ncbi:MAG: hypothetical protein JF888_15640 [Candidatus Dormibacteraeota bacterium]|uniref:Uncharacterized protein n=1 Tax=Candidatus Dormiibacter inghamiae TaxID=3127013 RepID=A0A934KKV5_9BACT|nr:hypothetical protein [Candidatus Dormibacteraeota bacterium]MBJ7607793.1 hypothetical protein [Candidatus Dormibacteraeota bacterium]
MPTAGSLGTIIAVVGAAHLPADIARWALLAIGVPLLAVLYSIIVVVISLMPEVRRRLRRMLR